ncbi:hypothetical protein [Echinimonas agarilytica]|uniref:Uncharacterized protein n=1 Tax=Echinimonas agarilytica TaxID=1215918 RepID=A0AA41W786_9GAMM|nr:hypothetical protein [Echinimonas agarilytica]MCM2680430.1 hypothetical protein [Echinimonas agarilytica]
MQSTTEMTCLDESTIEKITEFVEARGCREVIRPRLLEHWPQFRFIFCSEDDMEDKTAYKEYKGFSVFLMAAGMGCARLTHTPQQAIGLIIAEHETEW